MCGVGPWLSLCDMCSFLCCHFDTLRFGKLVLRQDDVPQSVCSVMNKLKVTRCC